MANLNRRGKAWTQEEESQLLEEIQKKIPIEMIADFHERTEGGIHSRLRSLAADFYYNNKLSLNEIQLKTSLSLNDISNSIAKREYKLQTKSQKKEKQQTIQIPEPIKEEPSDTKEMISLLKDIKGLLERFLQTIHYEE